jgi:hypothetical protein
MLGKLPKAFRESGQALLLVLLSAAVILTVVLSVVSRSVTDISVTTLDEEALRAFSAAEAGVERALIVGTDLAETVGSGGSSFSADISGLAEGLATFSYPTEIYSGESVYIWFVSHAVDGDLTCTAQACFVGTLAEICWGTPGTPSGNPQTPAVEVSIFYDPSKTGVATGNFSSVRVARATFDPSASRLPSNNFSAAQGTCSAGGESFEFSGDIDISPLVGAGCTGLGNEGCLLAARVRALYNTGQTHPIGINVTGGILPAQGRRIDSTGTSGSGASVRKIQAYRTFGGPPPIFDASVFSIGNVTK